MNIPRDRLGEALHSAMRKGCDSRWSSLMWGIIQDTDPQIWNEFLNFVDESFRRGGYKSEALHNAFREFDYSRIIYSRYYKTDEYNHRLEMDRRLQMDNPAQWRLNHSFDIIVNMIPYEDVEALMATLEYWFRETKTAS